LGGNCRAEGEIEREREKERKREREKERKREREESEILCSVENPHKFDCWSNFSELRDG
jgi:hypothetical protein